jgi:hypothetical protein
MAVLPRSSPAQTREQVRRAFADLRDDKVPHNCTDATDWLFENRQQLKDDLLDELYKTDWQGRNSILHALVNTEGFVPDERFIRFDFDSFPERPTGEEDWKFVDQHFSEFEPLLKERIHKTGTGPHDMFTLWAITWLAKKRGVLDQYLPLITPAVMNAAVANLRDDQEMFNASQAVRFFLLLGDRSLSTLREASKSSDKQTANLARATIDALAGKREPFGYFLTRVSIGWALFGRGLPEPDWVEELGEKYRDRQNYP